MVAHIVEYVSKFEHTIVVYGHQRTFYVTPGQVF